MPKSLTLLVLLPLLLGAGCSRPQTTSNIGLPVNSPQIDQPAVSDLSTATTSAATPISISGAQTASTTDQATDFNPFASVIKDHDIYCFGQKVGTFARGQVFMRLDDKVISFVPPKLHGIEVDDFNPNDLICDSSTWGPDDQGQVTYRYSSFSYQGLEVSTRLYGPYGIYKAIETPEDNAQITFRCDGSLAKPVDIHGHLTGDEPYLDCRTNGKDFLSQFEFNAAAGSPVLTTGGDFGKAWKGIYIKRSDRTNYIFMGIVSDDYHDMWSSDEPPGMFKQLSQKSVLDDLLKDPRSSQKIALWQMFVASFQVEPNDEFGLLVI